MKDLKLKVKHLTSEYEQIFDVKGLMDYTLYSLPFGDYQCNFIINSEYNSSDKNTTDDLYVKVLVPNNQSIIHIGNPIIENSSNTNSIYITFRWQLNHVSCDDVRFYYKVDDNEAVYVNYVKLQSFTQTHAINEGSKVVVISAKIEEELRSESNRGKGWIVLDLNPARDMLRQIAAMLHKE